MGLRRVARGLAGLVLAIAMQACGSGRDLQTAPVVRADISRTVTASGTLAAQDTVLVGSQVSGTIQNLYVDYNSQVRTGEILARLDPSTFQASLDQASATLSQLEEERSVAASSASSAVYANTAAGETAQSQSAQIAANDEAVRKAQSALELAAITARRDRTLLSQGYVAQNVVDNDESNLAAAQAGVTAAVSNARSARLNSAAGSNQAGSTASQATGAFASERASDAAVRAAQAAVRSAQINLNHATITSPVNGTVIERNVSVGQTVAAALAAPTLFTIAKDLAKMELDIAVGEPDVGAVRSGQAVTFSVLAYPGRTFRSTVSEVRQNPTIVNNVTTYDTVAYPRNLDGALRPGMTANVQIAVASFPQALVVPQAALQWNPSAAVKKSYKVVAATPEAAGAATAARSAWGKTGALAGAAVSIGSQGHVFVLAGNELHEVSVNILAIDGVRVGIAPVAGTLTVNASVVTGEGAGTNATAQP